ncbi:MAG: restriction endonuclease [Sphingopyxis sp.]|nr:MAG: restriction endonuclease [Sphingopyxis sp.]
MAGERWTEEQTRLALYLYFQLPFGKLHSGTLEIQQLADAIGRTHSSVAMKLCNFASLDPKITDSGRKGLDGASKLDREIFAQFEKDWTGLVVASETDWNARIAKTPQITQEDSASFNFHFNQFQSSDVRLTSYRVGQGFFRRAVLTNFDNTCCITGIADTRLLNASHIVPWSLDAKNRHNPANGFALSATFDRAFDRGMITITMEGRCPPSAFNRQTGCIK